MEARRWLVVMILSMAVSRGAFAADSGTPSWEQKPELSGILTLVPPLRQPLPAGWQQTLFWWQAPLSFTNPAALKTELQALSDRGLAPCIGLDAEYGVKPEKVAGQIADAKAVAEAGFPVHIQLIGGLDVYLTADGKRVRHPEAPDPDAKDAVGGTFPCLPIKDGWGQRGEFITGLMQRFADAGVPVAAVWVDYEGHPHPWNGVFDASRKCSGCTNAFPRGVLDDLNAFRAWTCEAHAEALATAFAKPVRTVFPKAVTGFYNYTVSSRAMPYTDWCGVSYPPSILNPPEIDVCMPVCYANTAAVGRYFNADWPISVKAMDAVYFATLLRATSRVQPNMRADQAMMPFVSSYVPSGNRPGVPRMSKPMYREFLRHAILRGARGFYCFNVAPPYGAMADYYGELADINAVYNELFAHPDFLTGGTPLNQEWPDPKDMAAVVWSGLRKGDQALVRVVTVGEGPVVADVAVFPGQAVRLLASPAGNTYRVTRSGEVVSLD